MSYDSPKPKHRAPPWTACSHNHVYNTTWFVLVAESIPHHQQYLELRVRHQGQAKANEAECRDSMSLEETSSASTSMEPTSSFNIQEYDIPNRPDPSSSPSSNGTASTARTSPSLPSPKKDSPNVEQRRIAAETWLADVKESMGNSSVPKRHHIDDGYESDDTVIQRNPNGAHRKKGTLRIRDGYESEDVWGRDDEDPVASRCIALRHNGSGQALHKKEPLPDQQQEAVHTAVPRTTHEALPTPAYATTAPLLSTFTTDTGAPFPDGFTTYPIILPPYNTPKMVGYWPERVQMIMKYANLGCTREQPVLSVPNAPPPRKAKDRTPLFNEWEPKSHMDPLAVLKLTVKKVKPVSSTKPSTPAKGEGTCRTLVARTPGLFDQLSGKYPTNNQPISAVRLLSTSSKEKKSDKAASSTQLAELRLEKNQDVSSGLDAVRRATNEARGKATIARVPQKHCAKSTSVKEKGTLPVVSSSSAKKSRQATVARIPQEHFAKLTPFKEKEFLPAAPCSITKNCGKTAGNSTRTGKFPTSQPVKKLEPAKDVLKSQVETAKSKIVLANAPQKHRITSNPAKDEAGTTAVLLAASCSSTKKGHKAARNSKQVDSQPLKKPETPKDVPISQSVIRESAINAAGFDREKFLRLTRQPEQLGKLSLKSFINEPTLDRERFLRLIQQPPKSHQKPAVLAARPMST